MKAQNRDLQATGRELQVLELAAEGFVDKQIALKLDISKDTVASYWRRILLKSGASNRTEVVARHAQQRAMDWIEDHKGGEDRLEEEVSSRTRAQASELAQRNMLQAITESSLAYISGQKGFREVFEQFLHEILGLTQSEYGFLAEVLYDENENPYLKTHAITNIAWNRETRELYDRNYYDGLEFRNLETLFGRVLTSGEVLISDDPYTDPRRGGLPPGHPPMPAFLGIPVFSGENLVGMIGLANRPGGYDEGVVEYLKPMIATSANYIMGWRAEQARRSAEQEIAESVELIKLLTNAVQTSVLYEDTSRTLVFVNSAFLRIFGADGAPENFIGMNCGVIAEHSRALFVDPEGFMQRVAELLVAREDCHGDIVHLTNGRTYERDFIVVKEAARPIGYLWKYREISDWRNEHETLINVFQSAMDAVIVMDSEGRVEFWNSKAEAMFGYTAAEAQDQQLSDLIVPPELRDAHQAGLKRYAETRSGRILNQVIDIPGLRKDGSKIDLELSITVIAELPTPRYSAFLREKQTR